MDVDTQAIGLKVILKRKLAKKRWTTLLGTIFPSIAGSSVISGLNRYSTSDIPYFLAPDSLEPVAFRSRIPSRFSLDQVPLGQN